MSTQHIRAAGQRFVRLIHCIAAQHNSVAADASLRVDHRIAPDDSGASPHLAADVEASKENEDMSRQVALYLYRAEQARCVVHLLAGRDEDVLSDVRTIARRLTECRNGQQKRQDETVQSVYPQISPKT